MKIIDKIVKKVAGSESIQAAIMLLPLAAILIIFLIAPMFSVFEKSVHPLGPDFNIEKTYTLTNYQKVFTSKYFPVFLRTILFALITTILCFALGYPLAYYVAMYGGKKKNIYLLLIMLPFWTSYLIRAYAWIVILRSEGIVNSILMNLHIVSEPVKFLNTPFAVVLGLTYGFLPFMTLPLYVALEASLDLGASPTNAFFKIVFPLSLPGVIAGSLLTFIPAVGDFIAADILGGPDTIMMGNLIQSQYLEYFDWPFGSALSFILMSLMLIAIFAYTRAVGVENT
jgi:spermidine/putrescine transport system permease protein